MRGGVVWDLDAVQLPGLNPSTTENTNIVKPSVLLAEERGHLTVPPICGLPHIPGEQKRCGEIHFFCFGPIVSLYCAGLLSKVA